MVALCYYKTNLHQLSLRAVNLPEIKKFRYYKKEISLSPWQEIFKSLQLEFKDYNDSYLQIDPYETDAKPILSCISNDLAEIYEDISPGLNDWENSNAALKRGIIWDWKFGYYNHWGDHATRAITALYALLYSQITYTDGDYIGLRIVG